MLPLQDEVVDRDRPETTFLAYRRGYSPPKDMRSIIADAHRTRCGLTLALAAVDHVVAWLLVAGATWAVLDGPMILGVLASAVAVVAIARQLRALECLVHESSHFNWSRSHRRWNDVLAFILAGMPTGALISDYRASHLLHHGRFGTALDPDRQRYIELGLEELRVHSRRVIAMDLLKRLPSYQKGWIRSLGTSPAYLLLPLLWTVVAVAPTALVFGLPGALVGSLIWLVSFVVILPVVRLIGEASEHVYSGTDTVFDATISNLGAWQRLIVHPHNDGYHTVHHMWPGVPHHALRKLHEALVQHDPDGYARRLRYRTRLLETPRSGMAKP